MKNRVLIICIYFGKLPQYTQLWLDSCAYNKDYNWLLVTDDDMNTLNVPKNVTVEKLTLEQLKKIIMKKTGIVYNGEKAYKMCDFRPAYGEIFGEYLNGYNYWAHCDLDMIFGDLGKYITDELLNKYDKIYNNGHLTIYRNIKEVNERYKADNPYFNYRFILENKKHYGFDESRGIQRIYDLYNINYYKKSSDIADINPIHSYFTILQENTDKQCFYWQNGKVFRIIEKNNKIKKEEFMYIHFQKRKMPINFSEIDRNLGIYITNRGFFKKENDKFEYSRLNKRSFVEDVKRRYQWEKIKIEFVINTIFVFKEIPQILKVKNKKK